MREKEVKGSVKRSSAQSRKEVSEHKGRESVRALRYAQLCFYPYSMFSGTSCLLRARGRGIVGKVKSDKVISLV